MRKENGCAGLIDLLYRHECADISADCVAEGYPSHGSNFALRVEQLWEQSYKDWTAEAETYRNPAAYQATERAEREELRTYQEEWRKNHSSIRPVLPVETAAEAVVME